MAFNFDFNAALGKLGKQPINQPGAAPATPPGWNQGSGAAPQWAPGVGPGSGPGGPAWGGGDPYQLLRAQREAEAAAPGAPGGAGGMMGGGRGGMAGMMGGMMGGGGGEPIRPKESGGNPYLARVYGQQAQRDQEAKQRREAVASMVVNYFTGGMGGMLKR